jgi:peptide/nickel transport system substrate-binding protein
MGSRPRSKPCVGNFADDSWMASKKKLPPYKQNLDRAEALLDEAGWTDHDGDGVRDKEINGRLVPFEFTMLVSQQPHRIKICTLLKENLDQIGIRMNVRPLEATVLQQLTQDQKFQAYFGGPAPVGRLLSAGYHWARPARPAALPEPCDRLVANRSVPRIVYW